MIGMQHQYRARKSIIVQQHEDKMIKITIGRKKKKECEEETNGHVNGTTAKRKSIASIEVISSEPSNEFADMALDRDTLKKELRKFTRSFLIYMILTVCDMVLGSLLFLYIEHCYEIVPPKYLPMEANYIKICSLLEKSKLLEMQNGSLVTNQSAEIKDIQAICDEMESFKQHVECSLNKETFSKWFEYTASIGFTVGYGHVVTRSTTGRIVTMFYIIPTIACTMVMYIHAANVIITIAKIAILDIETRWLKHSKVHYATAKVFGLQLTVTTLLVIGSALFYTYNNIREMTFIDALYFTITSLTTIGFGDFTLDFTKYLDQVHLFIVLCFLWFFGMGMVASLIAGLSELVSKYKFGSLAKIIKLKCCCEFKVERDPERDLEEQESCDECRQNGEDTLEERYRKTTLTNQFAE